MLIIFEEIIQHLFGKVSTTTKKIMKMINKEDDNEKNNFEVALYFSKSFLLSLTKENFIGERKKIL